MLLVTTIKYTAGEEMEVGFLGFGSTGQVFTPTLTNFPDYVQDITMGATQYFDKDKVVVALTTFWRTLCKWYSKLWSFGAW